MWADDIIERRRGKKHKSIEVGETITSQFSHYDRFTCNSILAATNKTQTVSNMVNRYHFLRLQSPKE